MEEILETGRGFVDMKKILKDRFFILGFFVVVGVVIIIFRLFNLQIVEGQQYYEYSQRGVLQERIIKAPRGRILDRNGIPIAVNRMGFSVQIAYVKMSAEERNRMIFNLVQIFEKNNEIYKSLLDDYFLYDTMEFGPKIKDSQDKAYSWAKEIGLKIEKNVDITPQYIFKLLKQKYELSDEYEDKDAAKVIKVCYDLQIKGYSIRAPLTLIKDVKWETVAEIEERHHELPGVTTDWEPFREYIDSFYVGHILGYIRGIDADEYEALKSKGYGYNDLIGKTGVEKSAEEYLRGLDGKRTIEVDTNGRFYRNLSYTPAEPGKDVVLTIDLRLQKAVYESVEKNIQRIREKGGEGNFGDANAAAVVVLDVKTGEVLAMLSYPTFDPAIFLAGAGNKEAQQKILELNNDSVNTPLLNRPIQGLYAPGSTFKPLTAIAGLEEGIIKVNEIIRDDGIYYIDGMKFECLEYRHGLGAHGNLTIERALATSCNIFFHILGKETGIDNLDKWAKNFGLGEYTGIDLPGEYKGNRNSRDYKAEMFHEAWYPADTAQAAIGQLFNQFTPLQIANYVSSIANGGYKYTPHVIKRITDYDGTVVKEIEPVFEKIPVSEETIEAVKKGMVAVTNSIDGTAVTVFDSLPYKVAGKTGTAQTGRLNESDNGLFVCYAPADNPRVAIAVVVEKGVWGSNTAPIALDILKKYFELYDIKNVSDSAKSDEVVFTR